MRLISYFVILIVVGFICYGLGVSDARLDILTSETLTAIESLKCSLEIREEFL